MPTKIDINLLPSVIRESIDPEILARAQSIEWSINRDTGEDEHGFLDGSHEDYLSSQNLMHKSHAHLLPSLKETTKSDWIQYDSCSGRDSGLDQSRGTTPAPSETGTLRTGSPVSAPLEHEVEGFHGSNKTTGCGVMKRHPAGESPFPIYRVNQEQLEGDVVFEVASGEAPGERTVHYEKSQRAMSEQELNALGLDGDFFGPNTQTMMDEQEEELIETSVLKGGRRELERLYNSMRSDSTDYFDRQRIKSASQSALDYQLSERRETSGCDSTEALSSLEGQHQYGTWGTKHQEQKQWKLSNGQWIRQTDIEREREDLDEPQYEKYMAERVRCTILLDVPIEEIKAEPIPTRVELKKPLVCPKGEEEKLVEDPDNLWMRMGSTQYGPPFGTLQKRKPREEEWIGPPCELCHKQIEERRCMLAENMKFHCWHFACSFCLKTLKPSDFLIALADRKPYCLNCHKREFPEISLVNLNLEKVD